MSLAIFDIKTTRGRGWPRKTTKSNNDFCNKQSVKLIKYKSNMLFLGIIIYFRGCYRYVRVVKKVIVH